MDQTDRLPIRFSGRSIVDQTLDFRARLDATGGRRAMSQGINQGVARARPNRAGATLQLRSAETK